PLSDLDGRIGRLEGNLMTAVAERLVGGSAAAAEGKRCFDRQVVLIASGVHHLDDAVRIVYAQRTVVAHRNRDLRHETSGEDEYSSNYRTIRIIESLSH